MEFEPGLKVVYSREKICHWPNQEKCYKDLEKMIGDIPLKIRKNKAKKPCSLRIQICSATQYINEKPSAVWLALFMPKNVQVEYEGLEKISSKKYSVSFKTNVNKTTDSLIKIKDKHAPYEITLWGNYKKI
ncbi:MAG: hypothetical protein PHH54_01710 [Candidatus Nanoarchaeia archaeon]|nr:hypothetical protein [Candidatus Nanoarchaeia archaeon]MDD5740678.1 hypothetical protein [Candidatus Nanoarchaeia archaeon]